MDIPNEALIKEVDRLNELELVTERLFKEEAWKVFEGRVLPEFPSISLLHTLLLIDKRSKRDTANSWIELIRIAAVTLKSK